MAKDLPINPRIIEQLAKATVKNLVDGIVELVTNSDDSYKRLEELGADIGGGIEIYIEREKYGICKRLTVKDNAEGMSKEELKKAIEFGGETSGFTRGRSVRGLFGRGLKETIIALGRGTIATVKNREKVTTSLWIDKKLKKPQYDDISLEKIEPTTNPNATEVDITVVNEKIKIPEYKKLREQITNHYALRDININPNRTIKLIFRDLKRNATTTTEIRFKKPFGEKLIEKEIVLNSFGDRILIKIYESPQALPFQRNSPYSLAGILIKTPGAILDNQLFKFENDPAAYYFYGEALCLDLEDRLRQGETELIDQNRGGLEWRHEYCVTLARAIEDILEPLVIEKKKSLEKKSTREVKETTKKMLRKLCNLLNELAKNELEEFPEKIVDPAPFIAGLQIKPTVANIEKDKPGVFSIYAPQELVDREGTYVTISSYNSYVRPLASSVKLEKHSKYPQIWYRYFKVVGTVEGVESVIVVNLGRETATAKIKVASPKKRSKGKITGTKGGFITDIKPDELDDPPQRVLYREGVITIYVKFPSVAKFIGSGLDGVETEEGRMLLAELVGEAFCRTLARQGIEFGKYPMATSEMDAFLTAYNELQKKYLHKIQDIILNWKFK